MSTTRPDGIFSDEDYVERPSAFARFWKKTGYLFGGFFMALAFFVILIPLFWLGIGTSLIYVGLFVTAAALVVAGAFANCHRKWMRRIGIDIPRLPGKPRGGRRLWVLSNTWGNTMRWRELLFDVLSFFMHVITFTMTVTWWAVSLNGLSYWFWQRFLPSDACVGYCTTTSTGTVHKDLAHLMHLPFSQSWLFFFVSIITIATLIPLTTGLFAIHVGLAKGLLNPSKRAVAKRLHEVEESRALATAAQTQDLRRIEHDLHDGPQQRLVRLGMDLATAERRLSKGDSEGTAQLLAEAREQVNTTLAEIRQISRTVAPPILAEQGLASAVESLGATSPVPSVVDAKPVSLSDAKATAVYFAVSESLANAGKYSGAQHVNIRLWQAGPDTYDPHKTVYCVVEDDGVGGAQILPGHGLAGLRDRLAGVDGNLEMSDREGGGTSVRISVPVEG